MSKRIECVSCNELFNSYRAYSRHRVALRCRPPDVMREIGMIQQKNGVWVARRNAFYHDTMRPNCGDLSKLIPR